jgi:hypothetical protein
MSEAAPRETGGNMGFVRGDARKALTGDWMAERVVAAALRV